MPSWVRAEGDSDNARYAVAVAFSAGGLLPLCGLVAEKARESAPLVVPLLLLWQALVWRSALSGVFVGPGGIKIRSLFRTRLVPWGRVDRVWAGLATDHDGWQIWVTTRDPQRDLPTSIRRLSPAIKRRGPRTPDMVVLPSDRFTAALATLQKGGVS
ncbi:PH domain-containing protein [Asanoa hainanensis]|uniref:PH domain-containing protein n=1 Tax=Asanoa hainanensis TaxID=560556 RepID=A0A239PFI8_9ACTN|nr:PH domain-containing protein [Asanoa hainanensis]SNT65801.1 PH domain-containing protein [Asanoa hainanensis]